MLRFRMADSSGSTQQLEERLELSPNHDSLEEKNNNTSYKYISCLPRCDRTGVTRLKAAIV